LVWPNHNALAVHIIVDKISLINFSRVSEVIFSLSIELSIYKVPLVVGAFELKASLACLFSLSEITRVDDLALIPDLSTLTVLYVLDPVSIIEGAVLVNKHASAMSFSVQPVSVINVTVGMSHLTSPI